MPERVCRCEKTTAASVLEGFACGNPECWRTPIAKESFDAFVAKLVRERSEGHPPTGETTDRS